MSRCPVTNNIGGSVFWIRISFRYRSGPHTADPDPDPGLDITHEVEFNNSSSFLSYFQSSLLLVLQNRTKNTIIQCLQKGGYVFFFSFIATASGSAFGLLFPGENSQFPPFPLSACKHIMQFV
jgi:hypothetical protein